MRSVYLVCYAAHPLAEGAVRAMTEVGGVALALMPDVAGVAQVHLPAVAALPPGLQ